MWRGEGEGEEKGERGEMDILIIPDFSRPHRS